MVEIKKHNWFIVDGEFRTEKPLTEKEFDELIGKLGDMYGLTKHSPTVDEDYGYEKEENSL